MNSQLKSLLASQYKTLVGTKVEKEIGVITAEFRSGKEAAAAARDFALVGLSVRTYEPSYCTKHYTVTGMA